MSYEVFLCQCCDTPDIHSVLCYRDTLQQNGQPLKDSSLDKTVSLETSFQITPADNLKSYLHNNGVTAEGTPDASQETADLHLPPSSETDLTSTAFTSSVTEQVNDSALSIAGKVDDVDNVALDSTLSIVQAPTSDLREEPQPATSPQSEVIKEQKQEQDLIHDPALANGLSSRVPESSGSKVNQPESVTQVTSALEASIMSLPDKDQMGLSLDPETPTPINTADIPHHPPVPLPEGAEIEAPIDPAPSPANDKPPSSTLLDSNISPSRNPQTSPADQNPQAAPLDQDMQEQVAQPVATEEPTTNGTPEQHDQTMGDAPISPAKVARPREEDDLDSHPAVKRPRTQDAEASVSEFKKPELPELSTDFNGTHPPIHSSYAQAATTPQHKHLLRILGNLKRSKDAAVFLHPVDIVALNIPNYPSIVTRPMDLSTLEEKEKNREYPTIDAFITDFNQIIQNSELFNGTQHGVTLAAYRMKTSFLKQMERLPGPEVAEPVRADKKKKAAIFAPSEKPAPPRRESRSSLPGTARSPIAPATPTFALGPQGIPLIRRDSTINAERPKREIHPPAPRDLPYANQKPRKKKFQMELKFCQHVLNEIKKPRYRQLADPFLVKVDPVALNIPTYYNVIKQPMDFGTIQQNLNHGEYESAKEFDQDAQLVFSNCYKFNPPGHVVHGFGKQLQEIYNEVWQEKQAWIEKQAPPSGPTSADTSPEVSEDEEDEEEEEPHASNEILKLQQQIAAMSKQVELITQKKKSPPAASKKVKNAPKPEKKVQKKAAPAPTPKSKASSKPPAKGGSRSIPYVTYEQKQDISNRINSLPENKMAQALSIIRDNMPKLKVCYQT